MAILNVTPDSFSDGGGLEGDPAKATERAVALAEAGAAIIDVGGESTRPGAKTVWEGDEIARVVPVIERLRATRRRAFARHAQGRGDGGGAGGRRAPDQRRGGADL